MRSRFAVAAAAMLCLAPPVMADIRTGVAAWAKRDYAAAIAAWRGPAEAGDPDAQYNLGQAYRRGEGVPKDAVQAEQWYRKAAAQGHAQAQAALGLLLFQNGDKAAAIPFFVKAATKGEPRAQYVIGTMMFNGDGMIKDWPNAYAMMSRAAAAGLQPATLSLGQMETYLSPAEKRRGAALAKTLAADETLSAAVRRSRATAVAGGATKSPARNKPVVAAVEPAPAKSKAAADTRTKPTAMPETKPAVTDKSRPATSEKAKPATVAKTKPATAAEPVAAAARGWKVQLGAFGTEAAARAHWTKLAKTGSLDASAASYVARGGVVRLQAGPFKDKAAATRACTAAAKAGSGCFLVMP